MPKDQPSQDYSVILLSDSEDTLGDADHESVNDENPLVLMYPEQHMDQVCVYQKDLTCLNPDQYINDTILTFYLRYIETELIHKEKAPSYHIFSSFFFNKLSRTPVRNDGLKKIKRNCKDADYHKNMCKKYHDRVKSWTKSVDIFEKDFVFIPIVRRDHWTLAVLCYPGKEPEVNDGKLLSGHGRPCILLLDSLNRVGSTNTVTFCLRYFLEQEWTVKRGNSRSFSKHLVPEFYPQTPRQPNYFDCGLYVMKFVQELLREPQKVIKNDSVEMNLRKWFCQTELSSLRKQIENILKEKNPKISNLCIEQLLAQKLIKERSSRSSRNRKRKKRITEGDLEINNKPKVINSRQRNNKSVFSKDSLSKNVYQNDKQMKEGPITRSKSIFEEVNILSEEIA